MKQTRRRLSAVDTTQMVFALKKTPMTVQQLAEKFDFGVPSLRSWLNRMHLLGLLRITRYTLDDRNRPFTPVWSVGDGPHAERPGSNYDPEFRRVRDERRRKSGAPVKPRVLKKPVERSRDGLGIEDLL